MLPEPYEYIKNIGFNDYYYFKLGGFAYSYLAINTVEEVVAIKQRRFRKDKIYHSEIPMALKLLPLNSLVLFLIYQANLLKKYTYELDVEGDKIDIYHTWDDYDFNDVRKVFKEFVVDVAGASNYDLGYTIKNHVARGFEKDGFMYLATEKVNLLNRSYWLIRTNEYGHLHIIEVKETGLIGKSLTTDVTEILLDRSLLEIISNDLDNGKFESEKEASYDVEDLDIVEEKIEKEGDK